MQGSESEHDRHDPAAPHAENCCTHQRHDGELSAERMELLERQSLGRIVHAFREYRHEAELEVARWETNYRRLMPHHQALLSHMPAKCAEAIRCAYTNSFFINAMLATFKPPNGNDDDGSVPPHLAAASAAGDEVAAIQPRCSPIDIEKVRYVLKNLVRDWSAEGAAERQQSYGRITAELQRLFPTWPNDQPPPRVLVPGSGLARLAVEVAGIGMEAEGNEFSYYMLLTASFVLNHLDCAEQFTLHPWMHSNCNQQSDADQLRGVMVPDVHPSDLVAQSGLMAMCAGDFVECYAIPSSAASFDCVATCFFIDTAHNIIEYLEVISHVLRPGGYWLNLGPLLYHWADSGPQELSVEVPLDEIKRLAALFGLRIIRDELVNAAYIANARSLYKTVYQVAWWTAVKEPGGLLDLPQTHLAQQPGRPHQSPVLPHSQRPNPEKGNQAPRKQQQQQQQQKQQKQPNRRQRASSSCRHQASST